jgi:hypothetical protein
MQDKKVSEVSLNGFNMVDFMNKTLADLAQVQVTNVTLNNRCLSETK